MKFSLGKFGLKHCDLPTMFSNVAYFLRFITIKIDQNYSIPIMSYVIVITAAVCYIYIYIFSMIWFVFVRCRQTGDFTAAAVVFSLGITSETSVTKLLFMIICIEKIQNLVKTFLDCDSDVIPGTRYHGNLQKVLLKIKKRVILIWIFYITTGVIYVTLPFLLPGRHFAEDLYVVYGLEPMFESPNYEIILISEALAILVCNYIKASTDAFIILIIGYIEAQMLALSDEIISLWDDAEKHYHNTNTTIVIISTTQKRELKMKIINEHIEARLKQVIVYHTTIINLLNDIERLFRVMMAVQFVFIIIAIVAELLGRVENTYMEFPDSFIQLYVYCLMGQLLIDASNSFEDAVYNCKWENFDKSNMRTILLMLKNAQKPLKLTAGGLMNLDFVYLMSIIKSTYSLYTTLKSTIG